MKPSSVEKLVWVLIYGGLLTLCLGLFVAREDLATGSVFIVFGIVAALVGAFLVWWRSRMTPPEPPPPRRAR